MGSLEGHFASIKYSTCNQDIQDIRELFSMAYSDLVCLDTKLQVLFVVKTH